MLTTTSNLKNKNTTSTLFKEYSIKECNLITTLNLPKMETPDTSIQSNQLEAKIERLEAKNQELELQLQKERIEKKQSQNQLEQEVQSLRFLLFTALQQKSIVIETDPSFEQQTELLPLPKAGEVPLYKDREDKSESAVDFLKRVYKCWLDAGIVIYQDQLRGKNGIDPSLMQGIVNQLKKDKAEICKVIPNKKQRIDERIEKIDFMTFNENYRQLEQIRMAIRNRKQKS